MLNLPLTSITKIIKKKSIDALSICLSPSLSSDFSKGKRNIYRIADWEKRENLALAWLIKVMIPCLKVTKRANLLNEDNEMPSQGRKRRRYLLSFITSEGK